MTVKTKIMPLRVFTIRLEGPVAKQFDFVCEANKLSQSKMVEAWATQDMRWHRANEVRRMPR